jgi:hypothetical protein
MIDAYRLVHGETKNGYSRLAHTVHTRIDRIYTQAYDSEWRWQSITAPPTLFTGKAQSDHLPVVAEIGLAKERPPSEVEAKINPAIFDNPNIRYITSLIWKKQIEKYPQEKHGHAKGCEAAKSAVATYLHYETNELRRTSSPISSLKAKIRITHAALEKNGPSPILTAKINTLHNEIEQARANFSHTTQTAKNNTAKEELLTKEFFPTFKSRTNNGDIADIYKTESWDAPQHEENNTTDNDRIILRELRKYYAWLYSEKPSLDNDAPLKALSKTAPAKRYRANGAPSHAL